MGQQAFQPGDRLGRYEIVKPLGAGGMGVVYLALDTKLERNVAIKLLTPGVLSGPDARERFHREALALAKLGHAHIAAIYDAGELDGSDFIVMEYVAGETLAEKLTRGPLGAKDATAVTLQIAQALEDAHDKGVIHRDLKPANVVVTPKGEVKVLDFGLAKLLARPVDETRPAEDQTLGIAGTPAYMSPEQAAGAQLDARTDLWSLGCIYYECLTGVSPFRRNSALSSMRAIADEQPAPVRSLRPETPSQAQAIVDTLLQKDAAKRCASAAEAVSELRAFADTFSGQGLVAVEQVQRSRRFAWASLAALIVLAAAGVWLYLRISHARWAREEAPGTINQLLSERRALAADDVLQRALRYAPGDATLQQMASEQGTTATIHSEPSGATVSVQDYDAPDSAWRVLGKTPLTNIRLPKGYFRWSVAASGMPAFVSAPDTGDSMDFDLAAQQKAPPGMVRVDVPGDWTDFISFVGWIGPYKFPPYYIDTFEVTNRDYQKFADAGGYANPQFWKEKATREGRELSFEELMALFRDQSGRPGPAGWTGGHFPPGQEQYPVTGVSWFEASAYAAWAGKSLPVMAQWYQAANPDSAEYTVAQSNFSGKAAPVGAYKGAGQFGTYDMAGNAREWTANTVDNDLRFILGSSWATEPYLYAFAEALSPFDRSATNGFRCVKNTRPLPPKSQEPVKRSVRDFAAAKPVSDDVFHAYELAYQYQKNLPLNATAPQKVAETADWIQEKVVIDTAYGERMPVYLFLPKHVKPPYQTVLFFPSARVLFLEDSSALGDVQFFDYIVQSGRAVIYPVYADMYERRNDKKFPSGASPLTLLSELVKDGGRALDYAATRKDLDSSKTGYLGVSAGSAEGIFVVEQLQQRLKTAVLLDGGYFLDSPERGADQMDFVVRTKIPVLMVNGRYDFTFPLELAQTPFFNMLGTPPEDKQHVVLETPHDVTQDRPHLVKAVLDWLDKYLGRVSSPPAAANIKKGRPQARVMVAAAQFPVPRKVFSLCLR